MYLSAGDKLEALVAEEAAQQATAAAEVSHLKAQLSQAEAAAAAAEQQADSLSTQFAEAQQALIDADRQVCRTALYHMRACWRHRANNNTRVTNTRHLRHTSALGSMGLPGTIGEP